MSHWQVLLAAIIATVCLVITTDAALAAMSIDLGSEFIKIGLVKPGVPMEIVLNKESRRKTPHVLVIKNGERLFAEAAAAVATKYPSSAYWYILSLLAKKRGDPNIELYKTRFPFSSFRFDESRNTVVFPSDNETYNVESLLAMILWSARKTTEAFAGQAVKDVVITVPIFFNQAERRALVAAANIAGLNLLQLLNDGSAAALNYGVFRRKEITEKPQTMMIYDMGASKTTATIVEYVLEADKSSRVSKVLNPVVRTIGVGYDRYLGGFEITLKLAKHLENIFRDTVKTTTDITTNARSMAKLLKEAERVKQVLSANKYHFAQIESLHEDENFRAKVTRDELEEMIADMEPRVLQPIKSALAMAGKSIEEVDQFVLMGAGTRVPKIQDFLKTILKEKEIGRFLNTDEAIALGAVYQAAELSKSFKVLPFSVKELIIFPIQVKFISKMEDGSLKEATRHIFGYKSHYPTSNKIITFQSYKDDFEVVLGYDIPGQHSDDQQSTVESTELALVSIHGLGASIVNNGSCEECEVKGVKTTFAIDLSGIVSVPKSEFLVEKKPSEEEIATYQEALKQYQAEKILLEEKEVEEKKKEIEVENVVENGESERKQKLNASTDFISGQNNTTENDLNAQNEISIDPNSSDSQTSETSKIKNGTIREREKKKRLVPPIEPRTQMLKIRLNTTVIFKDIKDLTYEQIESARKILSEFEHAENTKHKREEAMNALETLVYDLAIKIEDDEGLAEYMTVDEKNKISVELKRLRSWIEDEVNLNTAADEFIANTAVLEKLTASSYYRKNEREVFSNLINSTADWWKEKNTSYVKQPKYEDPIFTTVEIATKIRDLDRELKYLLNKMKNFKPKMSVDSKKEEKSNKDEDPSTPTNDSHNEMNKEGLFNETGMDNSMGEVKQEHDPSEL
ncbi:DnaK family protein [Dictyocaulus viviparus]|uniref:Hypoxia up-regulated protein 1 n=1 Tax=Dictyocaulus viviparus TaxID=29172 RepID=A0A0D8XH62_DICVI|nr:DnaK family protein [Dictyocaulus viviparus]